jgi:hypothetical protein
VYHLNGYVLAFLAEGRSRRRVAGMVTWLAWLIIVLVLLVVVLNLWMMWQRLSDATRMPVDSEVQVANLSKGQAEAEHVPPTNFGELDERGYLSSRMLLMGCEAAICRTPFGARIVAGKRDLNEPQHAWDYASVRLAEKALVCAEFNTHPTEGIIGVEDFGRGSYPAAEPRAYFRRWRYTSEGQLERI